MSDESGWWSLSRTPRPFRLGLLGAVLLLPVVAVLFSVRSSVFSLAVLVAYVLVPVILGLVLALVALNMQLFDKRQSLAVGVVTYAPPIVLAALSRFVTGLLGSLVATALVGLPVYVVPRLHRWTRERRSYTDLGVHRVPMVVVLVVGVTLTASGPFVHDALVDHSDEQCITGGVNPESPFVGPLGKANVRLGPAARFDFDHNPDAVRITHAGGDAVNATDLIVSVDRESAGQRSVTWSKLDSTTEMTVSEGDSVRIGGVRSGDEITVIARGGPCVDEQKDQTWTMGSYTVGNATAKDDAELSKADADP